MSKRCSDQFALWFLCCMSLVITNRAVAAMECADRAPCQANAQNPIRTITNKTIVSDRSNGIDADGAVPHGFPDRVRIVSRGTRVFVSGDRSYGLLSHFGSHVHFENGLISATGNSSIGVNVDTPGFTQSNAYIGNSSVGSSFVGIAAKLGGQIYVKDSFIDVNFRKVDFANYDDRIGWAPYGIVAIGKAEADDLGGPKSYVHAEDVRVKLSGGAAFDLDNHNKLVTSAAAIGALDGATLDLRASDGNYNEVYVARDYSAGLRVSHGVDTLGGGEINAAGGLRIQTSAAGSAGAVAFDGGKLVLRANGTPSQIVTQGAGSPVLHMDDKSTVILDGFSLVTTQGTSPVLRLAGAKNLLVHNSSLSSPQSATIIAESAVSNLLLDKATITENNGIWLEVNGDKAVAHVVADESTLVGRVEQVNGGKADVKLKNHTIWAGAANSSLTSLTNDKSTITFSAPSGAPAELSSYKNITVGQYVGNDGEIRLNAYLDAESAAADRLVVDGGKAAGSTRIHVTNTGGQGGLAMNGVKIVDAIHGGTTETSAFSLANRIRAGAFDYRLVRGGRDGADPYSWFLRNSDAEGRGYLGPEVSAYAVVQPIARQMGLTTLGTYRQRTGRGYEEPTSASPTPRSRISWGRVFGEHFDNRYDAVASPRAKGNIVGFQLGQDIWMDSSPSGHRDQIGVYAAYGSANIDAEGLISNDTGTRYLHTQTGKASLHQWAGAGYWTHTGPSGWYLDGVLQASRYNGHVSSLDTGLDVSGTGIIGSLEGGYPIKVGILGTAVIEPQAQIVWQRVRLNAGRDAFGGVAFGTTEGLSGRLGVEAKWSIQRKQVLWQPSMHLDMWRDWGGAETTFEETPLRVRPEAARLVPGLGLKVQIRKNLLLQSRLDYGIAVGKNSKYSRDSINGNLAITYRW